MSAYVLGYGGFMRPAGVMKAAAIPVTKRATIAWTRCSRRS